MKCLKHGNNCMIQIKKEVKMELNADQKPLNSQRLCGLTFPFKYDNIILVKNDESKRRGRLAFICAKGMFPG